MPNANLAIRFICAALVAVATADLITAQTVEKKTLTLKGAEGVIAAAKAEALRLQAPGGVIAVVDDGGNLMAVERLDGTFTAGANISIGKARTAVMFKKPTRFFEELINSSGKGRTVMTALENFTPLIGGIPITVDGQIVGGVGVSGAASAEQDEKLAIAGASALAPETSATSGSLAAVSFFEKSKVDEAFSKGAVLLDGSNGRNYIVSASRRENPGQAEVHTRDTDVIYVIDGSATFVTGGEAVDAITTAPGELRGSSIRNGTVLADRYQGKRLNSPNDLVYKSDGALYFTDPPFGLPKFFDDPRKELPYSGVFRVSPDGSQVQLVTADLKGPNGLAFSPDERYFYVDDWDPEKKIVMRFEVNADGTLSNGKVFFDMTSAEGEDALDGMKVDQKGNLYVSGPGGLWIISPEGKHLGTIVGPEHPHNFAWGDDDRKALYLCGRTGLYRIRLNVAGIRP